MFVIDCICLYCIWFNVKLIFELQIYIYKNSIKFFFLIIDKNIIQCRHVNRPALCLSADPKTKRHLSRHHHWLRTVEIYQRIANKAEDQNAPNTINMTSTLRRSSNGSVTTTNGGRSSSQISIYDYPEHLNPFYEDDNHKRIRFWKLNSSNKTANGRDRSNSFSLNALKEMW